MNTISSARRVLARSVQPIFLLLALGFVGLLLASQWEELRSQSWRLHPGWLSAALLCLLLGWGVEIAIWRYLLASLDGPLAGRLSVGAAARIWFLSAIVRYVPGNIWQPLGMTLLCSRRGIRAEATLLSVVLFQVASLLGVLPLAGAYLLITGNLGLLSGRWDGLAPWLAGLALGGILLFVARPGWLFGLMNRLLVRAGRAPLAVTLSSRALVGLILAGSASWLVWGMTFGAVAFGVVTLPTGGLGLIFLHFTASYALAYAIGYLSFFTPSGLGVREGAIFFWLAPVLGGGVATAAALAMRLLMTGGELLLAGVSLGWERWERREMGRS